MAYPHFRWESHWLEWTSKGKERKKEGDAYSVILMYCIMQLSWKNELNKKKEHLWEVPTLKKKKKKKKKKKN